MSVEEDGMTSISLVMSIGIPARHHRSVIRKGNGREVCFYLALMSISCKINNPWSILILNMIQPWETFLRRCKTKSFHDGIMVFLMKTNQSLAAMFRSYFSIWAPTLIHLLVSSEIIGVNHSLSSYNNAAGGNPCKDVEISMTYLSQHWYARCSTLPPFLWL